MDLYDNLGTMDLYEICDLLYNNKLQNKKLDISVNNHDLKTYFEMCVLITVQGFKHFFSNENNIVDIQNLSLEDFNKINNYLNHLNIDMKLKIINKDEFDKQNIKYYEELIVNNNTKLEDFNFIIKKDNYYIINFSYIYSNKT